jgi:hypothetical protein
MNPARGSGLSALLSGELNALASTGGYPDHHTTLNGRDVAFVPMVFIDHGEYLRAALTTPLRGLRAPK